MAKFIKTINIVTFAISASVVMAVFYEGLTREWYGIVAILILAADICFILATVINLLFRRKAKILQWFHIFSVILIVLAVSMKVLNRDFPAWSLVFWNFYIFFLYGIQVLRG